MLSTAAMPTRPITSTASPSGEPPGTRGPETGSRACNHVTKCDLIDSALLRQRRNQPRTVSGGRPRAVAILRNPTPATDRVSASPITSTESRRRTRLSSGINTCVTRQDVQRARRGRRRSSVPSRLRNSRHRPYHHGTKRPPQFGHSNSPASSARSTSRGFVSTINMWVPAMHLQTEPFRVTHAEGLIYEWVMITLSCPRDQLSHYGTPPW